MPSIGVLHNIKEKIIGIGAAAFAAAVLLAPVQGHAEEVQRLEISNASIPVSQIFEVEYANAVNLSIEDPDYNKFTYVLSTEDEEAPLPSGSVNGEYSFILEGNDTLQLPLSMENGGAEDIIFKHAGVYTYELKQDIEGEGKEQPPYTLDDSGYIIRVYVVNEDHGIRLESVTAENIASKTKVKGIEFSNLYTGSQGLTLTAEKAFGADPLGISKDVESVQVNLQRTITPDDENSWEDVIANVIDLSIGKKSVVFDDLLKYDKAGNEYSYRAYESAITLSSGQKITLKDNTIGGYTSAAETKLDDEGNYQTLITNTPITGSISAAKVWSDDANKKKKRPDTLVFRLEKDGVDMGDAYERTLKSQTKIQLEEENLAGTNFVTWTDLPVMHSDGSLIEYKVTEPAVEGYTGEITSGEATVRNTDGSISVIVSGKAHKGFLKNTTDILSGKAAEQNATLNAEVEFTNTLEGSGGSNGGGGGSGGSGGGSGGGGNVKTGDNNPIALYVGLGVGSLLIIVVLVVVLIKRRFVKKRHEEQR